MMGMGAGALWMDGVWQSLPDARCPLITHNTPHHHSQHTITTTHNDNNHHHHHHQIHWFSIVNSCVTVLLLTGFLATILLRVLKADFVKFSRGDGEMGGEGGKGGKAGGSARARRLFWLAHLHNNNNNTHTHSYTN